MSDARAGSVSVSNACGATRVEGADFGFLRGSSGADVPRRAF